MSAAILKKLFFGFLCMSETRAISSGSQTDVVIRAELPGHRLAQKSADASFRSRGVRSRRG